MKRRLLSVRCTVAFVLAVSLALGARAWAWTADQPVKGNSAGAVANVQVIDDGAGGTYTCWADDRYGDTDVFVQHLDASGAVVSGWPAGGVDASPVLGNQLNPQMVVDCSGGVLVCWEDNRTSNDGTDIYAQHLTSAGQLVSGWPLDGVQICVSGGNQTHPAIATDEACGAVMVWLDARNGLSPTLFAQRVTPSGSVLWTANGVAVGQGSQNGTFDAKSVVSDGTGGAIVTSTNVNGLLFAQRLSATTGTGQWTAHSPYGVQLSDGVLNNDPPSSAGDGSGGAYVAYTYSDRKTGLDIYVTHVDATGSDWNQGGTLLCNAAHDQARARLAADGVDGAVVCWLDNRANRSNNPDIYGARITNSGSVESCWPANGLLMVSQLGNLGKPPVVVTDGQDGVVLAWETISNDVFARRVSRQGILGSVVQLTTASGPQNDPRLALASAGTAVAVWSDGRFATPANSIYGQQIAFALPPVAPSMVIGAGSNNVAVTWHDPGPSPDYGSTASWEIRYWNVPIYDWNFDDAIPGGVVTNQGVTGWTYCHEIGGLSQCANYYFALRSNFACDGISPISTLQRQTQCVSGHVVICDNPSRMIRAATDAAPAPDALALASPSPNPADGDVTLACSIPVGLAGQSFSAGVYDVTGRLIRTLERGAARSGRIQWHWDRRSDSGEAMRAGVYFVHIAIGEVRLSKTILLR